MRPYSVNPRSPGVWLVAAVNRPNRIAAGLTATVLRAEKARAINAGRAQRRSAAALTLSVKGTLDPLAGARFDLMNKPCPCCGSRHGGKLALKGPYSSLRRRAVRLNPDRLP